MITAAEEIRGSTSPPSEKAPLQPKTAFGETRSKSNYLTIFVFTQPPKMIWKVIYIFDTTMNPHVSTLENLLLQPNFIKKIPQAPNTDPGVPDPPAPVPAQATPAKPKNKKPIAVPKVP